MRISQKESGFLRQVKNRLHPEIHYIRMENGMVSPGVPDLLLIHKGRCLFIEAKMCRKVTKVKVDIRTTQWQFFNMATLKGTPTQVMVKHLLKDGGADYYLFKTDELDDKGEPVGKPDKLTITELVHSIHRAMGLE